MDLTLHNLILLKVRSLSSQALMLLLLLDQMLSTLSNQFSLLLKKINGHLLSNRCKDPCKILCNRLLLECQSYLFNNRECLHPRSLNFLSLKSPKMLMIKLFQQSKIKERSKTTMIVNSQEAQEIWQKNKPRLNPWMQKVKRRHKT